MALALAAGCLVALVAGLALERGTILVGVAIVMGVLAVVAWSDGTIRRARERRSPPSGH